MITRKRSRDFYTKKQPKKQPKRESDGLMAYLIPDCVQLSELKSLNIQDCMILKSNNKHKNLAYFLSDQQKIEVFIQKKNKYLAKRKEKQVHLCPLQLKNNNIEEVLPLLQRSIANIEFIIDHDSDKSIPARIRQNQDNMKTILSENYLKFKAGFDYLSSDRTRTEDSKSESFEITDWMLVFYVSLAIMNQVSESAVQRFADFFQVYNSRMIIDFFLSFSKIHPVMKYLIFDIWYQHLYLSESFNNNTIVFQGLFALVTENYITKLVDLRPKEIIQLFQEIFTSPRIQKATKLNKEELKTTICEFIEKTFVMRLPHTINGITLCNRTVLINKVSNSDQEEYSEISTVLGFVFMTMLHELGHFKFRKNLKSDAEWFEAKSPEVNGIDEGGTALITEIFNAEPEFISIEASQYILKPSNWEKSTKTFRAEFENANKFIKNRSEKLQRRLKITLKPEPEGAIRLLYCGK